MTSNTSNTSNTRRRAALDALAWYDPLLLGLLAAWGAAQQRLRQLRDDGDRGATIVEYAIITAIGLGLAVGLGVAVTAVVHKYQAKIK
jgi:Flp pilus assembly pilin Flp